MMIVTSVILLIINTYGITDAANYISNTSSPCDSDIYCHGTLLHNIQMLEVFNDSKTFVDMKLKHSPDEIKDKFKDKMEYWDYKPTKELLKDFVAEHFEKENTEFENWIPSDWIEHPNFFDNIIDTDLKSWSVEINKIWPTLGRRIKDNVREKPDYYSIIYLPHPFIIPGGRFREIYYWDSYWIIRGLLICKMNSTARNMIMNYIYMIKTYGLIPNGGRIYYIKRSQPPMLIPMVKSYMDATNDMTFLKENINVLEEDIKYWITKHNVTVMKNGRNYTLAVYKDSSTGPRPESYKEDIYHAKAFETESEKNNFYSEIKAAAESGWDFSSRWFIMNGTNQGKIFDTKARSIVPVDLNSLLYWSAKILSDFYRDLNATVKAEEYDIIAKEWKCAVTAVLWHEEVGSWLDFDLINNIRRDYFYPTNISPLWTGCYDINNTHYLASRIMKYLDKENVLNYTGGIPTTLRTTKQQWDLPNAWPPLQYITVMALDNTGHKDAQMLASNIAQKWMCTNYVQYKKDSKMYEKYLVHAAGEKGVSNGEYEIQDGFGWTNGIVLEFLQKYNSITSIENWKITQPSCYEALINVTISVNNKKLTVSV